MKLCFVSVNGPREPYILDEPRICVFELGVVTAICAGLAETRILLYELWDSPQPAMHIFAGGLRLCNWGFSNKQMQTEPPSPLAQWTFQDAVLFYLYSIILCSYAPFEKPCIVNELSRRIPVMDYIQRFIQGDPN
jgi:hypothetical protein